ncbi:hypothetical protein GQ600_12483 [Phytophthora cactorum]|nr:hypothetical protein GQ600_12483 [Phytophthora cactorum]
MSDLFLLCGHKIAPLRLLRQQLPLCSDALKITRTDRRSEDLSYLVNIYLASHVVHECNSISIVTIVSTVILNLSLENFPATTNSPLNISLAIGNHVVCYLPVRNNATAAPLETKITRSCTFAKYLGTVKVNVTSNTTGAMDL